MGGAGDLRTSEIKKTHIYEEKTPIPRLRSHIFIRGGNLRNSEIKRSHLQKRKFCVKQAAVIGLIETVRSMWRSWRHTILVPKQKSCTFEKCVLKLAKTKILKKCC